MKKANEFRIGLWTIIAIVVMVVGIKYLKGQLHTTTSYYLISPNVERVAESSHVKLNGYKVGFVRDMRIDYATNRILLELSIDPSLKMPKGTSAIIQPDLLGNSNIYLTLGDSQEIMQAGDTLYGGGMAPGLTDGIADAMPAVMALLPKIDTLLTGLNVLVNDSKVQETLLQVNELSHKLDKTLTDLNRELPGILEHVDNASSNLDTLSLELRQAHVEQLIAQASATIDSVNTVVSSLNNTDGTAGKLINSDELHTQLETTLANIDSLVSDIKLHPKRYINIKLFGK
ncbi:MAG: MCE family protein [Bacteroidales bacterium]|nr:MCE family protein [Bacteroidales bacterium]